MIMMINYNTITTLKMFVINHCEGGRGGMRKEDLPSFYANIAFS